MVKQAIDKFGRVDILVNDAGVITAATTVDLKEDEWDYIMDVNAKGSFQCCKEVAPYVIRQKNGRIINISSIAGRRGCPEKSHYCA